MKKLILIIFLSFAFNTVAAEGPVEKMSSYFLELFIPKIEKFIDCKETLEKAEAEGWIKNKCIEKLAKKLDGSKFDSKASLDPFREYLQVYFTNKSDNLIVKKIDAQVEIACWNKEKCPQRRQLINLTNYANTAPGDGGSGIKPISIDLPEQKYWSVKIKEITFYGFKIVY